MKTHEDPLCDSALAVLDRPSRAARDRTPTEPDSRPCRAEHPRTRSRQSAPRRTTFEPLVFSPSSWYGTDFLTLGLGAVLIVGMFVAAAQGITWVILPGAAALIFAMISTQLRWGRMSRGRRLQWHRARRATGGTDTGGIDTGGIVQLPSRKDLPRRAG